MALIIEMNSPFRLDQQETVNRAALCLQRGTARDQRVRLERFGLHPRHNVFLRHRLLRRFHRKTGGEHFRQDYHITPGDIFKLAVEMAQIGRTVHPD